MGRVGRDVEGVTVEGATGRGPTMAEAKATRFINRASPYSGLPAINASVRMADEACMKNAHTTHRDVQFPATGCLAHLDNLQ